jgi:uncharacterized protein (TIGR03067 family)
MFAALLSASLLAPAAPVPKDFQPNDAKALVGKWHVETAHDGVRLHDRYPKNVFFEFDGAGQFTQTATGDRNVYRRSYTLDLTATPRRMTLLEPGPALLQPWVYELTGDTLLFAFVKGDTKPDRVRPMEGLTLYTLKRVKDDK